MNETVFARELRPRSVSAEEWNTAARRCGASYRGELHHLRVWAGRRWPRVRLRLFEVHAETAGRVAKIGQCAVAVTRHGGSFLDRLQLEPGHEDRWQEAMTSLLRVLEPGSYQYGWVENLEPSREAELRGSPGISVGHVRPLVVHAVEFSNWLSWDAYHRAVSTNVKRNITKARVRFPDLSVEWRNGFTGIGHVRSLVRLRSQTYERKGLGFSAPVAALSTAANLASAGPAGFTAVAHGGGRELAAVFGIRFGANTYYRDGGSLADNGGAAWLLLMQVIERAYNQDALGRLVMGYLDPSLHEETVSGGLLRQRHSCRVTELPTSVVSFTWSGSARG